MRWISKLPVIGAVRKTTKFAWIPTRLSTEETVWFERFYKVETYICDSLYPSPNKLKSKRWHNLNCEWRFIALIPYDNHSEVHLLTLKD